MNISIITVHLNDFEGLHRTYQSLKPILNDCNLTWVVIDGGSITNSTDQQTVLNLVSQSADYFCSEPDKGIYDAMNKGSSAASGEYLLFLNAGDELYPEFTPASVSGLVKGTHPGMIWGRSQQQYQNGSRIDIKTRSASLAWYGMPVFHSAVFFQKEIIGSSPYNCHFKIAADYDLICRLLNSGVSVVRTEVLVSIFHRGGISDTCGQEALIEESEIRTKYYKAPNICNHTLNIFKRANAKLSNVFWVRRLWRKWI